MRESKLLETLAKKIIHARGLLLVYPESMKWVISKIIVLAVVIESQIESQKNEFFEPITAKPTTEGIRSQIRDVECGVNMMIISIILTTYNRSPYLPSALASILTQTYPHFELILWDDGSTDGTLDIAQSYARQDDRIRLIAAPHQGRAQSLLSAHALAQGDYVGWVDSDDLLAPTALAETIAHLSTHPEVGMVYTDYQVIDEHNRLKGQGSRCRIPYSPQRLLVDYEPVPEVLRRMLIIIDSQPVKNTHCTKANVSDDAGLYALGETKSYEWMGNFIYSSTHLHQHLCETIATHKGE